MTGKSNRRSPEYLRFLARRELHVREARNDPVKFCEYVLKRDDTGESIKLGEIHREWFKLSKTYKYLMVIAPRFHLKTTVMIGKALFSLGRDKNQRLKILCQSDKKSIKRLTSVRQYMKNSDELHRVFPHLSFDRCIEWNKHMITIERDIHPPDPSIEALGITSSGTGDRATGLLPDDVVDRRNSITLPKVREGIKESWDDWFNLLGPDGWIFWISTLWHKADLTHQLMQNDQYAVAKYEIDMEHFGSRISLPDGTMRVSDEPLWGDADGGPFNRPALMRRKRVLTKRQFARSFSNMPYADGELKFDPSWLAYYSEKTPDKWQSVLAVDCAESSGDQADVTGFAILRVDPENPAIRIEDAFHRRLNFTGKADAVMDLSSRYRFDYIVVERAGGGISLANYLVKTYGLPVIGIKPHGASKAMRLEAITPYFDDGMILFSEDLKNVDDSEDRGDVIAEFENFGIYPTDDILDAVVHGIRFCTRVFSVFDRLEPMYCPECMNANVSELPDGRFSCDECDWTGDESELLDDSDLGSEEDEDQDDGTVLLI